MKLVQRTVMDRTVSGSGKFFWTVGDNIWIDNGGLLSSTSSNITGKTAKATFGFSGSFTALNYPVYYTGNSSTAGDRVVITTAQTQTLPNDFSHLGQSGDCGTTSAYKVSAGSYKFQLVHKAAYLCFTPREEDAALGQNIYLTKIVITSKDDIAGTYAFSASGLSSTPIGGTGSKTITLTTKGSGAYANGFPLTNTSTSIATNGAYVVIAPGPHELLIKYYLYDPVTGVEGFLYKNVVKDFKVNTVTDITANLKTVKVELDRYSTWDAKKHFWYGYENVQPKKNGETANPNIVHPDDREGHSGYSGHAIYNCKKCPNANEMFWYVRQGDPQWDNDAIFSFNDHLYKGGCWMLKRSYIAGFRSDKAPDGNDYTNVYTGGDVTVMAWGSVSVSDDKYFLLPGVGKYERSGAVAELRWIGENALFWSSSSSNFSTNTAGHLRILQCPGGHEVYFSPSADVEGIGMGVSYIGEMGSLFQ